MHYNTTYKFESCDIWSVVIAIPQVNQVHCNSMATLLHSTLGGSPLKWSNDPPMSLTGKITESLMSLMENITVLGAGLFYYPSYIPGVSTIGIRIPVYFTTLLRLTIDGQEQCHLVIVMATTQCSLQDLMPCTLCLSRQGVIYVCWTPRTPYRVLQNLCNST